MDDARAFDVERVARHEMPQPFDPLRRADKAAGGAYVDLALLAQRVGVTFGAFRREHIGRPLLVPRQLPKQLRDDVAGPRDVDAVAGAAAQGPGARREGKGGVSTCTP